MLTTSKIEIESEVEKDYHDIQIEFDACIKRFIEQAKVIFPTVKIDFKPKETYETWN